MEFTHIANPVRVQARVIRDVILDDIGDYRLTLEDGSEYVAGPNMTARYTPLTGDYLVRQEDGYEYVNPKDVFERKYRAIGSLMIGGVMLRAVEPSTASQIEQAQDWQLRERAMDYATRHYPGDSAHVVKAAESYYQFLKGAA